MPWGAAIWHGTRKAKGVLYLSSGPCETGGENEPPWTGPRCGLKRGTTPPWPGTHLRTHGYETFIEDKKIPAFTGIISYLTVLAKQAVIAK